MKKFWTIIFLFIIAVGVSFYAYSSKEYTNEFEANFKNFASSTLASLSSAKEEIFTASPLIGGGDYKDSKLSISGVILYTNQSRAGNGNLKPLKENDKLNKAAKAKLDDMFNGQYFEHESPSGIGPSDLAKTAGYQYIIIGENLALGNFKDDADLVTAWMNSPGHRANILKENYEEIGVAVGQGIYEGRKTWMAVQEFGKPRSSCPSIDFSLKGEIDSTQAEVEMRKTQVENLKVQIDSTDPKTQEEYDEYNKKVQEYNDLVHIYNNLVDNLKEKTATYNSQVNLYNSCLAN